MAVAQGTWTRRERLASLLDDLPVRLHPTALLLCHFGVWSQRGVCRPHRLADHPHQVFAQRPEVSLVVQPVVRLAGVHEKQV